VYLVSEAESAAYVIISTLLQAVLHFLLLQGVRGASSRSQRCETMSLVFPLGLVVLQTLFGG